MRVVVTGGAGFPGFHLRGALLRRGDTVVCVDDLSTGRQADVDGDPTPPDGLGTRCPAVTADG
ncbi:NAD-dependent epimerase/dehydratase family protein [Geodermatophilus sp. TF02-6]|uniref:NAD-dependent epimerase/dehydratase family protein n=1 Tax=Geodermatophilus sp. TF02-6 TaxID=2250575 RepID=UPI0018F6FC7F|nr:NAD-dependent epimerase/dehydratase family protein [Geodermatophilus sp. TF02-6]